MNCRSCKNNHIISILSLGEVPLANRLLKSTQLKEKEPKYPLELVLCTTCSLIQLKDTIPPSHLFDEYLYFSSHSDTMIQSAKTLVEKLIPTLPNNAMIIEVASNDGYLLQHYINRNIKVLGIEPAKNIAEHAIKRGIPTKCNYFNTQLALELIETGFQADVIHANNVMAHVPDINDFVFGLKQLLGSKGQIIIEVPYLINLISHGEFDTIYHEHVYYFSLLSLIPLFHRHGLIIADVEEIPIHGGSLRLYIKHHTETPSTNTVNDLLEKEKKNGVNRLDYYQDFSKRILTLKEDLLSLLTLLKKQGKKIAAYGASAKGSTLLNFFGITHNLIDFVVDRSPIKQGYFMSGVHLPIYSPEHLIKEKISYTLLLTWNFAEEILNQQKNYREQGGQFIIPIPMLQVV